MVILERRISFTLQVRKESKETMEGGGKREWSLLKENGGRGKREQK